MVRVNITADINSTSREHFCPSQIRELLFIDDNNNHLILHYMAKIMSSPDLHTHMWTFLTLLEAHHCLEGLCML